MGYPQALGLVHRQVIHRLVIHNEGVVADRVRLGLLVGVRNDLAVLLLLRLVAMAVMAKRLEGVAVEGVVAYLPPRKYMVNLGCCCDEVAL